MMNKCLKLVVAIITNGFLYQFFSQRLIFDEVEGDKTLLQVLLLFRYLYKSTTNIYYPFFAGF